MACRVVVASAACAVASMPRTATEAGAAADHPECPPYMAPLRRARHREASDQEAPHAAETSA
ncbi:hypothetical protein SNA_00455 [Streptomyces natalensis ATCC 27448]|uniref:Secreted protein n=1 Tax=Streptomyces natalensis ATCC 27448 TaxID=1240678 RepID=A0A0D7CTX6_9ACTN|nr:hypothetical protein SNA_00455 [Streptomyces natalensis ATCC 27448]